MKQPREKKAWAGRFAEAANPLMEAFTSSLAFDKRLALYDIQGSIAHCKTLGKARVLTAAETTTIVRGLESVKRELDRGRFRFTQQDEDIHMAIERRLTELIGDFPESVSLAAMRTRDVWRP